MCQTWLPATMMTFLPQMKRTPTMTLLFIIPPTLLESISPALISPASVSSLILCLILSL